MLAVQNMDLHSGICYCCCISLFIFSANVAALNSRRGAVTTFNGASRLLLVYVLGSTPLMVRHYNILMCIYLLILQLLINM